MRKILEGCVWTQRSSKRWGKCSRDGERLREGVKELYKFRTEKKRIFPYSTAPSFFPISMEVLYLLKGLVVLCYLNNDYRFFWDLKTAESIVRTLKVLRILLLNLGQLPCLAWVRAKRLRADLLKTLRPLRSKNKKIWYSTSYFTPETECTFHPPLPPPGVNLLVLFTFQPISFTFLRIYKLEDFKTQISVRKNLKEV